MTVYKGRKTNSRVVECRAVGCEAAVLDQTLKALNSEGWNIRQVFQEAPTCYRIFAQRETPVRGTITD